MVGMGRWSIALKEFRRESNGLEKNRNDGLYTYPFNHLTIAQAKLRLYTTSKITKSKNVHETIKLKNGMRKAGCLSAVLATPLSKIYYFKNKTFRISLNSNYPLFSSAIYKKHTIKKFYNDKYFLPKIV